MLGFRQSKFKHIYGQGVKKELCYDNVRVTKNAWDSNLIKVNPLYLSINWDSADADMCLQGGGAFAVVPLAERGKLPDLIPLFKGHSAPVLDTDFNPFNDSVLASASEDSKICLWSIPPDFTVLEKGAPDISPVSKLSGHSRKVGNVTFHPNADNVLASTSGDYTLKLWDVIKSSNMITLKHPDIIQSLSFNREGSALVTTCRDKKIRVWDPRMEKVAQEASGHSGAKNSRAVFLNGDRVATAGFDKMSDRQLGLWDIKKLAEPLGGFTMLDQSAGVIMPFYDYDTKVLYLAGKGDGNIRYYEFQNDEFWPLAEYKSSDPQRGVAFMPKRALSVRENEIMRAYKTVRDVIIEPVSFIVPRRSEAFQDDIYPDSVSGDPSLTSDEWFAGANAPPNLLKMESVYRQGSVGHTSQKREFIPSDVSKSKLAVRQDINSSQSPESIRTATVEPATKVQVPQASLAPETKESGQRAVELPRTQPPTESHHTPEVHPEKLSQEPDLGKKSSSSSSDDVLQRLLSLVETQSQTLETQAERILWLEEKHSEALKALKIIEGKLEAMAKSKITQGLEDGGTCIEI